MKTNFALLILVLLYFSCTPNNTCENYKTGQFNYKISGYEWLIERNDSIQTEYCADLGIKTELKVSWIGECSYVLKFNRMLQNKPGIEIDTTFIVHSNIVKTGNDFYETESIVHGLDPQNFKFTRIKR